MRGALCQTASSSRPSIEGGCVARIAIAVAGGDCDSVFGCWDDATIDSAQSAEMAADGISIRGSGQRCPVGQRIPVKGWDARVRETRAGDPPSYSDTFCSRVLTMYLGTKPCRS